MQDILQRLKLTLKIKTNGDMQMSMPNKEDGGSSSLQSGTFLTRS